MKKRKELEVGSKQLPLMLALHSSSETLGIAIYDPKEISKKIRIATFPLGRKLSNNLLECIEEVLPHSQWQNIGRLGVALGPGGFTGTRLTVVLARTLAQQLNCPLNGVSSFALMAPRLALSSDDLILEKPFWIENDLPRRGKVAGQYLIKINPKFIEYKEVVELTPPHLLKAFQGISPVLKANEDVSKDVMRLLEICEWSEKIGLSSCWSKAIPFYPTSPVGNIQ